MDLGLTGRVAVVTGASKGIGLAITRALLGEGVRVIAGARDVGGDLAALAGAGDLQRVAVDLSTPGGPAELVAHAETYGGLDILVKD